VELSQALQAVTRTDTEADSEWLLIKGVNLDSQVNFGSRSASSVFPQSPCSTLVTVQLLQRTLVHRVQTVLFLGALF
jgi:hypothetical protein